MTKKMKPVLAWGLVYPDGTCELPVCPKLSIAKMSVTLEKVLFGRDLRIARVRITEVKP